MTNQGWHHFAACVIGVAVTVMALTAGLSGESQAQMKPSLKIKLNVSPSINISRMDADLQSSFTEELAHLKELIAKRTGGADSVSLSTGFSISAYENISVLVSGTTPKRMSDRKDAADALKITCGYLNDGTTYFRRATITNKSAIQFRLRNNSLLKRSMKLNNPLFVAYVFFLINQRKEKNKNESPLPLSTITVEFL